MGVVNASGAADEGSQRSRRRAGKAMNGEGTGGDGRRGGLGKGEAQVVRATQPAAKRPQLPQLCLLHASGGGSGWPTYNGYTCALYCPRYYYLSAREDAYPQSLLPSAKKTRRRALVACTPSLLLAVVWPGARPISSLRPPQRRPCFPRAEAAAGRLYAGRYGTLGLRWISTLWVRGGFQTRGDTGGRQGPGRLPHSARAARRSPSSIFYAFSEWGR